MGRRAEPKPRHVSVVRYYDAQGRQCAKNTPGAVRRLEKSETYYLELPKAGGGKERIALKTTSLDVAWVKVRAILKERHDAALGISDDRTRQAARPIAEHVEDWLEEVAANGSSPKRVRMLRQRVTDLIAAAGWERIGDIRRAQLATTLAAMQADSTRGRGSAGKGRGLSDQTRNHYLSHARQLTRWLHNEGRLAVDPLANARGVSVEADRRHDRRVPGDEEIEVLFTWLCGGFPDSLPAERCGMSGPQRALGYEVAMCSGLRAGELRSLGWDRLDLGAGDIHLGAQADKARRRRLQALPRWLCEKLRAWHDAGGELWGGFPEQFPGRLLQADLRDARAAWIASAPTDEERQRRRDSTVCVYEVAGPDGPLYWDMHSSRHWYASALAAQAGIPPAVLQAMMRHSDPKLTLDRYAKARREGVREAADQVRLPGQPG